MSAPARQEIFSRTSLLLGDDVLSRLWDTRVILFGVGGVGSWCAEGLIRSGIGHLTLVDSDRVSVSNVGRQLMATVPNIGRIKVDALRERLLQINPEADIRAVQAVYEAATADSFDLDAYDYVLDAIDSLRHKMDLIVNACRSSGSFFSSMGAALKVDPTRVHVAYFDQVKGCPLGFLLRKNLRRQGRFPERKFLCVYGDEVLENRGATAGRERLAGAPDQGDEEQPGQGWDAAKARINGTAAHITAIFGMTLSGLVIQDVYKRVTADENKK